MCEEADQRALSAAAVAALEAYERGAFGPPLADAMTRLRQAYDRAQRGHVPAAPADVPDVARAKAAQLTQGSRDALAEAIRAGGTLDLELLATHRRAAALVDLELGREVKGPHGPVFKVNAAGRAAHRAILAGVAGPSPAPRAVAPHVDPASPIGTVKQYTNEDAHDAREHLVTVEGGYVKIARDTLQFGWPRWVLIDAPMTGDGPGYLGTTKEEAVKHAVHLSRNPPSWWGEVLRKHNPAPPKQSRLALGDEADGPLFSQRQRPPAPPRRGGETDGPLFSQIDATPENIGAEHGARAGAAVMAQRESRSARGEARYGKPGDERQVYGAAEHEMSKDMDLRLALRAGSEAHKKAHRRALASFTQAAQSIAPARSYKPATEAPGHPGRRQNPAPVAMRNGWHMEAETGGRQIYDGPVMAKRNDAFDRWLVLRSQMKQPGTVATLFRIQAGKHVPHSRYQLDPHGLWVALPTAKKSKR